MLIQGYKGKNEEWLIKLPLFTQRSRIFYTEELKSVTTVATRTLSCGLKRKLSDLAALDDRRKWWFILTRIFIELENNYCTFYSISSYRFYLTRTPHPKTVHINTSSTRNPLHRIVPKMPKRFVKLNFKQFQWEAKGVHVSLTYLVFRNLKDLWCMAGMANWIVPS